MDSEAPRRLAVYGNSLNMAGIVACLRADTTLEVLCINPDSPDADQSLEEKDLAAIVFELTDPSLHVNGAMLRDRPGLLLIGVDLSKDEMLVLSCRSAKLFSIVDLIDVIHHRESPGGFVAEVNGESDSDVISAGRLQERKNSDGSNDK